MFLQQKEGRTCVRLIKITLLPIKPINKTFLACMFCFLISGHVLFPQRRVSLKCFPIQVHMYA